MSIFFPTSKKEQALLQELINNKKFAIRKVFANLEGNLISKMAMQKVDLEIYETTPK